MAKLSPEIMQLIVETGDELGLPPQEVLKQLSYETGGTLDPRKKGPTTQHGQHEGLIQFGKEQANTYGADFSSEEDAWRSQLGRNGAIVKYLKGRGFKPGEMGGLDMYSTINAGSPGRYGASDANNGGAPGSVRDKYENQMGGHDANAARWMREVGYSGDGAANGGTAGLSYGAGMPNADTGAIRSPSYHDYSGAGLGGDQGAGLEEPEEPLTGFAKWKAEMDGKLAGLTGKPIDGPDRKDQLANAQFLMQNGLKMMNGGY